MSLLRHLAIVYLAILYLVFICQVVNRHLAN